MSDAGDPGRATLPEGIDSRSLFEGGGLKPVLVVLTGPQVGQRVALEDPAVIGRDPVCELMLTDETVGWHHARVVPGEEGGWEVVDLTDEEEAGIEVNGARVSRRRLAPDDQINVGHTVIRFEVHDPVEQAYDEAVLERLNKDELTGLLARRRFDIDFRSAVAAAARDRTSLGLIILDVDRLKAINDARGHLVGAAVIAAVGARVGEVVAERGFACRLGGDEFGVALPGGGPEAAMALAEELRQAVRARPVEVEGASFDVVASAGVALFPEDGATPLELLRRADQALYEAKRAGGDQVARWVAPELP